MNYMKGYNNRERRRRRRSRFSKGSDNYIGNSSYSSRSKYRSSMGQAVSGRWIVCLIALIVLIAVGAVCLVQAEFGDDEQPKGQAVASGSGVTVTQTAQATAAVTAAANGASAASQQTKVPEKGQATYAPDGVANEIAAVPTLAPQTIPTPVPKIRSKAVALSFDDGPSTVNTPKVLALLKQYQAHATFFVVGSRVKEGAEILKQEVAQGCEIGNHTWDHANLAKLSMEKVNMQYDKTADLVKKMVGYDITLLRPPYGAISEKMRKKLKHPMVLWNTDTLDWKSKNTKAIMKEIKKNVKDGGIILMHDIHPTTVEALKKVLPWLVKNDYDILTVSELAKRKGAVMHNGKAYGGFTGN